MKLHFDLCHPTGLSFWRYTSWICFITGQNSLNYYITAISNSSADNGTVVIVGYVDDTQFVRFDEAKNATMQPKQTWMNQTEDYWTNETRSAKESARSVKASLRNLRGYYNDSGECLCVCWGLSPWLLLSRPVRCLGRGSDGDI